MRGPALAGPHERIIGRESEKRFRHAVRLGRFVVFRA
jgi:hypothetical protein